MNEKNELVRERLTRARDDELSAVSIIKHKDGAPSTVCFLAQQMAEKFLKGLLVAEKKPLPKIHDLLQLGSLLKGAVQACYADLILLNRYYIEPRYPGDYPEFGWKEAQEALDAALRIKKIVRTEIG